MQQYLYQFAWSDRHREKNIPFYPARTGINFSYFQLARRSFRFPSQLISQCFFSPASSNSAWRAGILSSGSVGYSCIFNHTWTQTWPCIVPVKNDKHSFRCTVCNKVIGCGKQGIGDVKRHIQRDEHKKNAKGSKNQTTLFQACAQAQNNEDKVCT